MNCRLQVVVASKVEVLVVYGLREKEPVAAVAAEWDDSGLAEKNEDEAMEDLVKLVAMEARN